MTVDMFFREIDGVVELVWRQVFIAVTLSPYFFTKNLRNNRRGFSSFEKISLTSDRLGNCKVDHNYACKISQTLSNERSQILHMSDFWNKEIENEKKFSIYEIC